MYPERAKFLVLENGFLLAISQNTFNKIKALANIPNPKPSVVEKIYSILFNLYEWNIGKDGFIRRDHLPYFTDFHLMIGNIIRRNFNPNWKD